MFNFFKKDVKSSNINGSLEVTDYVSSSNYANKTIEFYYFIPAGILEEPQKEYNLLVCVPGLYTRGESFVKQPFKDFAIANNLVIIAPSFKYDRKNLYKGTSYQFPKEWSGKVFLEMVKKVEKRGIKASKYYLFGFSAGAQFVTRFSLWKPELCIACAAHGSGGRIIPEKHVDTRFFVSIGNKDHDRMANMNLFLAGALKHNLFVDFKQYEAGHRLTVEQILDSIEFFKTIISTA